MDLTRGIGRRQAEAEHRGRAGEGGAWGVGRLSTVV